MTNFEIEILKLADLIRARNVAKDKCFENKSDEFYTEMYNSFTNDVLDKILKLSEIFKEVQAKWQTKHSTH